MLLLSVVRARVCPSLADDAAVHHLPRRGTIGSVDVR
jgi:hypothetical protein